MRVRVIAVFADGAALVCLENSPELVFTIPADKATGILQAGDTCELTIADNEMANIERVENSPELVFAIPVNMPQLIRGRGYFQLAGATAIIPILGLFNVVVRWPLEWANTNYEVFHQLEFTSAISPALDIRSLGVVSKTTKDVTFAFRSDSGLTMPFTIKVLGIKT